MKKAFVTIMAVAMFVVCGTFTAKADDSSDIAAIKQQIADLQKKLADIEAKQSSGGGATALQQNLQFHGYFRGRVAVPEAESTSFEATEITFEPSWNSEDGKVTAEGHFWFYPGNTLYLESAFVKFNEIGAGKGGKLIAGKTRNWCYGQTPVGASRLVSDYPLYSEAVHHDRVTGLQLLNKLDNGKIDFNIALINGFTPGIRRPGIGLTSTNSVSDYTSAALSNPYLGTTEVLASREAANVSVDSNGNKAVSVRLAGNVTPRLNIGVNAYSGKLSETELSTTAGAATRNFFNVTGFTPTDKKHTMAGGDFRYKLGGWTWQAEMSAIKMAGLKFNTWQSLVGYDFDAKNSAYLTYGSADYKIEDKITAATLQTHSGAWDKDQWIASYKYKINKKAWLQAEYEINGEDVPNGVVDKFGNTLTEIDNNVFFLEYFVAY